MGEDYAARLDRIESKDEIRQLSSKYALAVDMRDIDAVVNLYVADVKVSREASGRQALKDVFDRVLRNFRGSVHHVGNQIIEFDDADNAHGIVYCRCEHEIGDKWVPMYLYYLDLYRRDGGRWYFKRRNPCEFYAADVLERPAAGTIRWPGAPDRPGNWHAHFPSWAEFWGDADAGRRPVGEEAAPGAFLDTMRRGERRVVPADFSWAGGKES